MSGVCAEGRTPQLMLSPANLPPGKDAWSFRMPQSTAVMAIPIVEHWKKTGVKTYGFLGYSDGYGEAWLTDIKPLADKAGIRQVAVERAMTGVPLEHTILAYQIAADVLTDLAMQPLDNSITVFRRRGRLTSHPASDRAALT